MSTFTRLFFVHRKPAEHDAPPGEPVRSPEIVPDAADDPVTSPDIVPDAGDDPQGHDERTPADPANTPATSEFPPDPKKAPEGDADPPG